jgi:glutamate/tyrosine decarboxylase-like PLP-dependent enzyme
VPTTDSSRDTQRSNDAIDARTTFREILRITDAYLSQEADLTPKAPLPSTVAIENLPIAIPAEGVGQDEATRRLLSVVMATPTTSGPRFVNQLFAGRDPLATGAEMITALLNTSMYTYKAAGPQVLVEREVMERMLRIAGLPGGGGMFAPGGSMSNLAAMIAGRNETAGLEPGQGFDGRTSTLYMSTEAHYSVRKNAMMIGLGRDNVRGVAVDDQGRMDPKDLAAQIAKDRADGFTPLMIVATSGTTVMGSFDPIEPLADIAAAEGLWLHVDGAYGGSALMHPEHKKKLAGVERADSFTWDAHKIMGVPLTCSVALTKDPALMQRHFDESADYLFQDQFDLDQGWMNPGTRSLQCGRRNDALKLWVIWQALGDRGFADRVETQFSLATYAAGLAESHRGMRLSLEPQWMSVCFEVIGKPSDLICKHLGESGKLKIGHGVVNGRRIIRLVTANPDHTTQDIDRMFADILETARGIPDGDNAIR